MTVARQRRSLAILSVLCWPMRVGARRAAISAALLLPPICTPAAAAAQPERHPYAAPVAEAAQRFGIPELWIWRVMHAESRGRIGAVSHAGAMGLMQIMPATWASLTARHRLGSDPFDPRANILAGAAYPHRPTAASGSSSTNSPICRASTILRGCFLRAVSLARRSSSPFRRSGRCGIATATTLPNPCSAAATPSSSSR